MDDKDNPQQQPPAQQPPQKQPATPLPPFEEFPNYEPIRREEKGDNAGQYNSMEQSFGE